MLGPLTPGSLLAAEAPPAGGADPAEAIGRRRLR